MLLIDPLIFLLIIIVCISGCFGFLEVMAGFASYAYEKISCGNNCCNERGIPADFKALSIKLRNNVFGQPLVRETVVNALKSHWSSKHNPSKALTISFHGMSGVGKNYVSNIIQEALYSEGMKSPHVHNFNARIDFPEEKHVKIYQKNLAAWISGNVTRCPKQIFVFDEVHLIPVGVLDAIKPFIDYITYINGVDYKQSIFIFLSNTGSSAINQKAYELWKMNIDRNNMKLSVFERIISQGAFNEIGGFQFSENIKSNLIDHYIPFLPLMKEHVIKCIVHQFNQFGVVNPTEKQIKEVLAYVDWGPDSEHELFSKSGCKRLSQKVAVFASSLD